VPLGKVTGQPFHIDELCEAIERELDALGSRVRDAV